MSTAIRSEFSLLAERKPEPNTNAILFLDKTAAPAPVYCLPEGLRELSRFFTVMVLVSKSAVEDEVPPKELAPNKSATDLTETSNVYLPPHEATAWPKKSNATDAFEFGGVKGCFSTMEVHRNGRPVTLTNQEFKTLAYLIKNPRRVISRDELLNEVWGYEN